MKSKSSLFFSYFIDHSTNFLERRLKWLKKEDFSSILTVAKSAN